MFVATALGVIAVVPSVGAATNFGMSGASSADLTAGPDGRTKVKVDYEKYETRTTRTTTAPAVRRTGTAASRDMYYTAPVQRSSYVAGGAASSRAAATRTETARTTAKRKYFLAHPFFQPTAGKFGIVGDLSMSDVNYNMQIQPLAGYEIVDPVTGQPINPNVKWDMGRTALKLDVSYGISDKLAVLVFGNYAWSDYSMDWEEEGLGKVTVKDDRLDIWGGGLQWRFVDNADWIATVSGFYQHYDDMANAFAGELKAGYKIEQSTIYGVGRLWYLNYKYDYYGVGMYDADNDQLYVSAYEEGDKTAIHYELGAGLFSVLDEDWTLNLEATIGSYEWHSQAAVRGGIGWQPGESFALELYGRYVVYDDANGKDFALWYADSTNPLSNTANAAFDNYNEYSAGIRAILYF